MFNYLQKIGLLFTYVCLGLCPRLATAQACDGQEGALPDTPVEVGNEGSTASNPEVTCFYFRFDSDITGWPTGITMDLWHQYEGDLGIFVEACGERLNVLQRPGAVGNCDSECAFDIPDGDCGSPEEIGTEEAPEVINFYEIGTEPDDGISNGGSFGLTLDDDCGVSTLGVNSFAELWSNCPEGLVEAEICFSDHASRHYGYVSNLNFIFPNPYICGCMDPDAINYNPDASVSSGDCFYECPDWVVEVPAATIDLCQSADTILLSAAAPDADNPSCLWIGTGIGNLFLEDAESAETNCFIPADFVGSIVYTVICTDQYGCMQSEAITVNVAPAPSVEIIGETAICGNDSTELVVQGGPFNSITWNTGANTDTIRVGAGTYDVTVQDDSNCPAVASITVTAFPEPAPMISGPDTICYTDTATLQVDPIYLSYLWSNGDTVAAIQVNDPGAYILTVTDNNGCSGVDTFLLAHFDSLQLQIDGPLIFCPGDSTTLSANAGMESYLWSTGDTTAQITVYAADTLQLMVVDSNGCSANAMVVVEEAPGPMPEILGPAALCAGDTAQLVTSMPFVSYQWSTGSPDSTIFIDQTGTYGLIVTDSLGCVDSTTFVLTAAEPVIVDLTFPDSICAGNSATIAATPGFAQYEWSTGDTTSTIIVPGPGVYELTVTSAEACTAVVSAEIAPFITIPPVILGADSICPGATTVLTATGDYFSYEWQDGTPGASLFVDSPGTYSVQARDANNCVVEASFAVAEFDQPEVAITGDLLICVDGDGTLEATPDFSTYSWSVPGAEEDNLLVSEPGSYALTVTDENGCSAEAEVVVAESVPQPVINGPAGFCFGSDAVLMVEDTFSSYQWSDGVGLDDSLVVGTAGTYSVTVTDAIGCEAETSIAVAEFNLPEPSIVGETAFCEGASTTLSADAAYTSYAWSIGNATTSQISVSTAESVSLTVTDSNGCVGVANTSTLINPLPIPVIVGDLDFCPEGNTTLSTTENYASYSWSTGSTSDSTLVDTDELVSLTVTDANQCTATTTAQPALYEVTPPNITGDLDFCVGESTLLTATAGYASYTWSDGQDEAEATFSTTGAVMVIVEDLNGCLSEAEVQLGNFPQEVLTVTEGAGFCEGESTSLQASGNFTSYAWSTTEGTATITVDQADTYSVTATDVNGCTATADATVEEYLNPTPVIDGSLSFCAGFNTTLGTEENYVSYLWSDNSTDPELTVDTPGDVAVTVTDSNGCTGSTAEMVELADGLSPVIVGPTGFCPGESIVLRVAGNYATISWSDGSGADTLVVDSPGAYAVSVTDNGGCAGENATQIAAFPAPSISIVGPDSLCAGTTVELSANGDAGDLLWNTGSPNTMISATAGTYSLILTDTNGCPASDELTITEVALPVFEIDGDDFFCAGDQVTLSVTPFDLATYSYDWSTGDDGGSATVNQEGEVSLEVTGQFGCAASNAVAVLEVPLPMADPGSPGLLDCDTDEVLLGGPNSSEGDNYIYTWSGPGINTSNEDEQFPLVNLAGIYELQVIDNDYGCASEISVVEVRDSLQAPQVEVFATNELNCTTQSVTLDGSSSDTGPSYEYRWLDENMEAIPNAVGMVIEVSEAQVYTLQIIDTFTACVGEDTVAVALNEQYPSINFIPSDNLDCVVEETSITANVGPSGPQFELSWTASSGGNIISGASTNAILVDEPAWYYLQAVDPANGCTSMDSVQVFQDITPPVAVTNDDQTLLCNDESVTLSGEGSSVGGFAYQWYEEGSPMAGETSLQLQTTTAANYTLLVTNLANGCTAVSDVAVSLDPDAPQIFNVLFDPPTCQGDTDGSLWVNEVAGGSSPYLYSFNDQPFSALTNYSGLGAGTYEMVVEDANGCQLTETVVIPDGNDLSLELGPDRRIEYGELIDIFPQLSIDSSSVGSLLWRPDFALPCTDCLYQRDLLLNESTRFFLTVTDENGCTVDDNILIIVERDQNIYVPNGFSPNGDGRNDRFYIFADSDSVEEIELLRVFNRWGEFVWENTSFQPNDPTAGWDGKVGGMDPNPAVYVWYAEVRMRTGEKVVLKGDVTLVE